MNLPPVLVGDPLRLGQVMLNLCNNAIKFTEKGEVELQVRREPGRRTAASRAGLPAAICRAVGIGPL